MAGRHYPSLLKDVLPEFAVEFTGLLKEKGFGMLAAEVPFIAITDRCRCGDSFCATMHTLSRPINELEDLGNFDLQSSKGMIILHVSDGKLTQIEVLYRDDVRHTLMESLP